MIEVVDESVVWSNPHPHLRSRHAWHPSLVHLDGMRWLVSFDIGEAVEAHDYGTVISRSDDDGASWSVPERVLDGDAHDGSYSVRLSRLRDGELALVGVLHRAREADQGLLNPGTFGYTPSLPVVIRGDHDGRSFGPPVALDHPFVGAELETCHSLVELGDGRLALPSCTWMSWDGSAPFGMKAVLIISNDRGRSWTETVTVADDWERRVTHFEQSLVRLLDGRLLAVTWKLNVDTSETEPTPFHLTDASGAFSVHGLTGFAAQTAKLCVLGDGTVLCAWRGARDPGLWLTRARIEGERWIPLDTVRAWSGQVAAGENPARELSDLRFGYPNLVLRPDGDVEMVFWCRDGDQNVIRRMRVHVAAG